ncbi:MAG TPA: efflux RND transporter permease subunit [Azospirillaceae bacterium]|nr:efflux RND transporter permease subunit [Azospirillaceae bacterium]
MITLINAALARTRTVLTALLFILAAGWMAWQNIPKESFPDINIPIIYVSVSYSGISPEDSERLLLRPIEQEVRTIEGVKEMRSTAYLGGGNVILEFEAGFDADQALRDVREKVDLARANLPDGVEEPKVNEVNFSLFPVLTVILSGEVPERTLVRLARDLQDRIETIPTVLEAQIVGDREERVEVVIDPLRLESYGISANEVLTLFARSNRLVAAGNLDTGQGRFPVKVPGLIEDVRDIWEMPIKVNGDAVVRFSDVAEIRRTFKDPDTFARLNGQRAIALEVVKRSGENIIDTIERVREVVDAERRTWPDTVRVTYTADQSEQIRTMLSDLENNLSITVLLVMIIVVGTLGLRTSALVGIAVPGSFLATMLVLMGMGYSINMVVLFGLILAAGNVVDGAIVVTEYADRKMDQGMPKRQAYGLAARRMAWPIIASTATQLAVFAPLLFWPGIVGEFMKFLPISQFATLLAALMMALIFVPVLGGIFGRRVGPVLPYAPGKVLDGDAPAGDHSEERKGFYVTLLRGALRHPGLVLLGSFGTLAGIWIYYAANGNGVEFFPDVEPEQAAILVHARGNLSVREQDRLVREVENRVLQLDEFDSVYTRSGKPVGGGFRPGGEEPEDVIGRITLDFKFWSDRRKANDILADIRQRTADIPGIYVEPRKQEEGPPQGKAVQVRLASRHPELLVPMVQHVLRGFDAVGNLIDREDTRPLPGIEWQIHVDRAQAAKHGVDVAAVGDAIRLVTNGLVIGDYRPDDSREEIDIVIRFPERYRSLSQLDELRLDTGRGAVPLANFVTRTPQSRVSTINRVDAIRVMDVKADVPPGILPDSKVQEVRAWLDANPVDPRVQVSFKGADQEQQESATFLTNAFLAGLAIMGLILITQFNSFYATGLILSSVVMSTVGVVIGLMITGQPFGIVMTGMGVIALAGIVVQNNIVLIDTYDQYRRTEATEFDAILRTGAERVRPVLLTALNTVLGLLPLAFGVNIDLLTREITVGAPSTQWWTQIAAAICFGLTFATILTLVVTPCALMVRANVAAWFQRRFGKQGAGSPADADPAYEWKRAAE